VAAEVDSLTPGRALDLATGEGRHAVWLAANGWRVVAVDFSGVGLRKAQARARAEGVTVAWAQADVLGLRFPPDTFDLVLAAFFHFRPPDRSRLYREVARTLTPNGTFVIVGYDEANLVEGSGGPQDPELLLRPAALATELADAGLQVERADTVRVRLPLPDGGEGDVVNAVLRARAAL
jgi:SAM-dependent methyltransferase